MVQFVIRITDSLQCNDISDHSQQTSRMAPNRRTIGIDQKTNFLLKPIWKTKFMHNQGTKSESLRGRHAFSGGGGNTVKIVFASLL